MSLILWDVHYAAVSIDKSLFTPTIICRVCAGHGKETTKSKYIVVMLKFSEWLSLEEGAAAKVDSSPGGPNGIYPPLYTQYYNYPPSTHLTWGADNITFLDPEDYKFRFLYRPFFTPHTWKTINAPGRDAAGG